MVGAVATALLALALTATVVSRGERAAAGTIGGPYRIYMSTASSVDALAANGLSGTPSTFDTQGNAYGFGAVAINATATLGVVTAVGDGVNLSRVDVFTVPGNTIIGSIQTIDPVAFAMDPLDPNTAFAVDGSGDVYSLPVGAGTVAAPSPLLSVDPKFTSTCSSIAVDPTAATLVVGCYNYGTGWGYLYAVSVPNHTVIGTWQVPYGNDAPVDVVTTPDGSGVVVAARAGRLAAIFRLPIHFTATTTPVWAQRLIKPVAVPTALSISPDGGTVYVGGNNGANGSSGVAAFAGATGSPGASASVPLITDGSGYGGLTGLTLTPDGRTLLAYGQTSTTSPAGAVQYQNLLYPLTPDALTLGSQSRPLPTGNPAGQRDIAVTPDQAPVANLAPASGTSGVPLALNASASNVAYGSITRYNWSFGDGSSRVTSGPTVAHTYASAGSYTATVTETDSAGSSVPPAPFTGGATVNGPGTTPFLRSASSAAISAPVRIGRPGAPPPPPPTTLPSQPFTTTTTTTTPTPVTTPTPGFHPVLTLQPAVGGPGTIVMASGHGFPPNKSVTVAWSTKTGSFVENTDAHGDLPPRELDILTPDLLGPRSALAATTGSPLPAAVAPFLVVPNTAEPGGGDRLLFRSEGP